MSALGLESYDRALNDPKLQHLHERIQDLRDNHCANTELLKFPTSRAGITLMASGPIGSAASKAGTILRISTNSVVNVFKVGMKAAKIRTEKTVKIFDVKGNDISTILLPKPKMVKHHLFNKFRGQSQKSQHYRDFFANYEIKVDQYCVEIPATFHREQIHRAGNNWTTRWKQYIDNNPDATTRDVYQFAGQLMDEYSINHLSVIKYR